MDNQRSRKQPTAGPSVATHLRYPHRLNLYDKPPLGEITLEEFQTWSIDRLRVLSEIENSFVRNRTQQEIRELVKAQGDKYIPLSANTAHSRALDAERKKDHVSHFILRLAFCRSEELKRRFVKAETALFRARWEDEGSAEKEAFLQTHGIQSVETVDESEKAQLKQKLAVAGNIPISQVEKESYIKVPWTKVTTLVLQRRVYLHKGMAYVPSKDQSSVLFQEFTSKLERALDMTEKALPPLDEDDRIKPIVDSLSQGMSLGFASEYTFGDEVAPGDAIKSDMVDDLAKKHWPLCMKNLHDSLRRDKHLKHFGRLQYWLFLKGMGMSLEDAMIFWRKSFSNTSDDQFRKQYSYNIKHAYGQVGARINYSAKSCAKIITTDQPGTGDNHGCPFAHFSPENLTLALSAHYGISSNTDINEILNAVHAKKYHVACTRVFEITHHVKKGDGVGEGESVSHPNTYAIRSREMEGGTGGGVKKEEEPVVDQMEVDDM